LVYNIELNEVNNVNYFDVKTESSTAAPEEGLFSIIPNPAGNSAIIRYVLPNISNQLDIHITSIQGQRVYQRSIVQPVQIGDAWLDLSELANGVYLVQLKADGYSQVQKLIVSK
jgi:hypothetical protein